MENYGLFDRVARVGCGDGGLLRAPETKCSTSEYIGRDFSPKPLVMAAASCVRLLDTKIEFEVINLNL